VLVERMTNKLKPSPDILASAILTILEQHDVENQTFRSIRAQVETDLNLEQGSLDKTEFNSLVHQLMNRQIKKKPDAPVATTTTTKQQPPAAAATTTKAVQNKKRRVEEEEEEEEDREEDNDDTNEGDELNPSKQTLQKDASGYYYLELGNQYSRLTVKKFKGTTYVDLRKFYADKSSGEMKPTGKGISLTLDQWNMVKSQISQVDQMIRSLK